MRSDHVSSSAPFAETLLGQGFYKLGYVTTDRDRAIAVLSEQLGIERFQPFDPTLEVRTSDGRSGTASLKCAFSVGREIFIEVMEPVSGLVDLFSEPLSGGQDFELAFHHIGVLVDDMDAALANGADRGITPDWSADLANGMRVTYSRLPALGHWVEHVYYGGDSARFLDSLGRP
jgi:hypothetical protein